MSRVAILLWLLAAPAMADEGLSVNLVLPAFGEPLFGEIEVGAEIHPADADVERVEVYLDGELMGLMESPPYRLAVDVGEENVEHHFLLVVVDAAGATARAEAVSPRISVQEELRIELQQLFVTVERDGTRVLDLQRGDFEVVDNGIVHELVTFERGGVPFTAVLLLDASQSMAGRPLEIALSGAEAFVRGMHELDQAKLMLFADRLVHETPFTNFGAVLTVGLSAVEAGGGTAVNDSLYLAMKRLGAKQGRRVIVLLSDGVDVESVLSMAQVRWAASRQQPVLYWIRLSEGTAGKSHVSQWRGGESHKTELKDLERTVLESGGHVVPVERIEKVEGAFRAILEDLRNQYVLGYYPEESTGEKRGVHQIEVRLGDPDLEVRARTTYRDVAPRKRFR